MRLFCAFVTSASLLFCATASADSLGRSGAVALVRQAIAFVYSPLTETMGTGFAVYTNGKQSYVLTAAHVVEHAPSVDIYFSGDLARAIPAKIADIDVAHDIALLSVPAEAPAQVTFASGPLQGASIGTLGYAAQSVSYWLKRTGELRADSSFGSVTRVHEGGRWFDDTAQTFPGDSGAPIFSLDDGTIVGMVRGHHSATRHSGFEAVGSLALREMLARHQIVFFGPPVRHTSAYADAHPYLGAVSGVRLLHDVPGARHFIMLVKTSASVEQNSQSPDPGLENSAAANPATQQLRAKLGRLLGSEIRESQYDPGDNVALGHSAFQSGNVGAIRVIAAWHVSNGLVSYMSAEADVAIVDKYGDVIAVGHGERQKHSVILDISLDELSAALADAASDAFAEIQGEFQRHGAQAADNFARFGIPLGDGERSAFIKVVPDSVGAHVTAVYPYGTAARAGLQVNDEIVALDGERIQGLSAGTVLAHFDSSSHQYVCTVMESDGRAVNVVFTSEDVRWYLEHPLK